MKLTVKKSALALFLAATLAFPLSALAEPGNVKSVEVDAQTGTTIDLSWNDGTENAVDFRVYYNSITDGGSVQNGETFAYVNQVDAGDDYTVDNSVDPARVRYTLTGLDPNTTYYMAITALDSEGKESGSYSLEVNTTTTNGEAQPEGQEEQPQQEDQTPEEENNDSIAPMVLNVAAEDSTHVLIGFSEAVKLTESNPETAFTIKQQINASNVLDVMSAELHPNDASGKTVRLQTMEQTNNVNYVVTVGIGVKDLAGNPIISGASDSGLFTGTNDAGEETAEETNNETTLLDCGTHYADDPSKNTEGAQACFEVNFGTCSQSTYTVVSQENGQEMHYAYEIKGNGSDTCQIETQYTRNDAQPSWENQSMTCSYDNNKSFEAAEKMIMDDLESSDCTGPLYDLMMAEDQNKTTEEDDHEGHDHEEEDEDHSHDGEDHHEEASDLKLSFEEMADGQLYMVNLTWAISDAINLFDQVLYQSTDGGQTYGNGESLGKSAQSHSVGGLEEGEEYTFKLTTKNAAGVESEGVVESITITVPDALPESGAGMGLILLGSGVAAHRILRRRRRK